MMMTATELEIAVAGAPTADQWRELALCAHSFRHFLRYWRFRNRETGEVADFRTLWPGQARAATAMHERPWLYLLKAGKLGFTELECAFDAWVARFRQRNARVHLFSLNAEASKSLLEYVRFGLEHLPPWMRLPIMAGAPGGDTTQSLRLYAGQDDTRTIFSYAAGPNVSIDQTAQHTHVDELARMMFAEKTWTAIETTVAPAGTCHIVTRGAGDANYAATIYRKAIARESKLFPFFSPWHMRPGRDTGWYEQERREHSESGIKQWAPRTWQEALSGGEGLRFNFDAGLHIVAPFPIPDEWTRGTGTDYGFTATKVSPWWCGFLARTPGGVVYLYDELYGHSLSVEQAAQRTANRIAERGQAMHFHGADPAMWNRGKAEMPSPADEYAALGIKLTKASNERVNGWALFDKLLAHQDGEPPRFFVFDTCREFLRTFPALPCDPHKPDDVDTDAEDDPADGARYGLQVLLAKRGRTVDTSSVGVAYSRYGGEVTA